MATTNPFLSSPFDSIINKREPAPLMGQDPVQDQQVPDIPAAQGVDVSPQQAAPRAAAAPASLVPPKELRQTFAVSAAHFNVPENVLMALAQQESSYRADAKNPESDARGIAGYREATAKSLGINQDDPNEAIPAMAMQLRERLDNGMSLQDAVAEHFAGPNRKLWGPKTAAYGQEVLDKAEAIGKELYGDAPADDASAAPAPSAPAAPAAGPEQNQFAPTRMRRADYEKNFKAMNPRASQAAVDVAMAQYDQQVLDGGTARAKAKTVGPAPVPSADEFFDQRLDARLKGKQKGVVPQLPGNQQPAAFPDTSTQPAAPREVSTFDTVAGNLTGGALHTLVGAIASGARLLGADDVADEFMEGKHQIQARQQELGGDTFKGKVAGLIGGVLPAMASSSEHLVLQFVNNAGLFGVPAFEDTYKAKLAEGQSKKLAAIHAMESFGLNTVGPMIMPRGVGALMGKAGATGATGAKAAGLGLAQAAGEGVAFSGVSTVSDKLTDTIAGQENNRPWLDPEDMAVQAAGFGAMRAGHMAPHAADAAMDKVAPSFQLGRALQEDVGNANFTQAGADAIARDRLHAENYDQAAAAPQDTARQPGDVGPSPMTRQAPMPQEAPQIDPQGRIEPVMGQAPAQAPAAPSPAGQSVADQLRAIRPPGPLESAVEHAATAPAAGPMESAIAEAAAAHAENPAPLPVEPQAPATPDYASMPVDQLRQRLREVAQATAMNPAHRKTLMAERKEIEQQISARGEAAKANSKPATEPLEAGPFDDMKTANKMMERFAVETGQPHEVVAQGEKFVVKPMGEVGNGIDTAGAGGRSDGRGPGSDTAGGVGHADGKGSGRSGSGIVEGGKAELAAPVTPRVPDAGRDRVAADGAANHADAVANPHATRRFPDQAKAEAFLGKQADGEQFEAVQTGPKRWSIQPRAEKAADPRAAVEAITKEISHDDARKIVGGKTEKPGGVDPARQIGASEGNRSVLRMGEVPLSMFKGNEDGDLYDSTVNRARAEDYRDRPAADAPPVIAVLSPRTGKLNILDGGHRITAARMRGDSTIEAIVSLKPAKENADVPQRQEVPEEAQAARGAESTPAGKARTSLADARAKHERQDAVVKAAAEKAAARQAARSASPEENSPQPAAAEAPAPTQQREFFVQGHHASKPDRSASISIKADDSTHALEKARSENSWFVPKEAREIESAPAKTEAPKKTVGEDAATKKEPALSMGKTPNSAEPITVKDGVIHIGDYPAQDYETGADVTVPKGSTPQQVKDALVKAGVMGKGTRVFGTEKAEDEGVRYSVSGDQVKRELSTARAAAVKAAKNYDAYDKKVREDAKKGIEPDAEEYFAASGAANESEAAFGAALAKIPDADFALEAKTPDGRTLMLNASAQKPGEWQLTRFGTDGAPWGDTQYPTKLQAIKDFLSEADLSTVNDFNNSFDPANPDIRYSTKGKESPRDLIITHNLTEANLFHAEKMGGIAVPSLAVTKKDSPLSGFGEITMIGSKAMADPKGYAKTQVFGADIYSPRYPSVEHDIDTRAQKAFNQKFSDMAERTGMRLPESDDLQRNGIESVERSIPVKAQFLKEHGIEPTIVPREGSLSEGRIERLKKFGLVEYLDKTSIFDLMNDPKFVRRAVAEQVDAYRSAGDDKFAARADRLEQNESLQDSVAKDLAYRIIADAKQRQRPEADRYKTEQALEQQVKEAGLGEQYREYVEGQLSAMSNGERIYKGMTNSGRRTYIPHTLENVVKILKKELRGGENFSYGVGSLRAHFTPQFKTIAHIQKEKGRLVSHEQFEQVKKEIDGEFEDVAKAINPDAPLDTIIAILEDAPKMGLERAAAQYRETLSADAKAKAGAFLDKLTHLPTEYFEAKILRDVDLAEFSGAVIPAKASQRVRDLLKSRGVPFKEYANEAERAAAIDSFAQELDQKKGDILFSTAHPMAKEAARAVDPLVQSLADKGAIVLHQDASTLPVKGNIPAGVQALTTRDGVIHVVANALGGNGTGIVMHEAFHAGTKALIGSKAWGELNTRLGSLYRQGEKTSGAANAFWTAARQRVEAAKAKGAVAPGMEHEEFGAYAIEEYARAPATIRKWVDDLVGHVKAWALRRFGKQLGDVTPAQLTSLAKLALLDARAVRSPEMAPAFSADRRADERGPDRRKTVEVDGVRRPIENSKGQPIAEDAHKQIAFWRWAKDTKAVDEQGRPLVLYHGTGSDFAEFNESIEGAHLKLPGIFFAPNPADANNFAENSAKVAQLKAGKPFAPEGANVMPVYLSMKKPLVEDLSKSAQGGFYPASAIKEMIEYARSKGHDGVILKGWKDGSGDVQYIVFKPEQIKSATGNSGEFSADNPDIRYSVAGAPQETQVPDTMRDKLAKMIGRPVAQLHSIAHGAAMLVVPMEAGSVKARALAKDFANQNRQAAAQWQAFDNVLRKNYSEQDLAKMWTAADQENDLRREGRTSTTEGLASLPADQRETVEVLHAYGEQLWERAKRAGLVSEDAEGVHYWTPRVAANIYADGSADSIRAGGGEFSKEAKNLRTSASSTKQRKHETTAESEAALKAKLGEDAAYVKNIRVMPMAMAQLEKAIAGRTLVNQIKAHGQATGQDLISDVDGPNFTTFDHPALKRWMPRMKEQDGKMVPLTDSDGNIIMEALPLFVRKDFAGPLRAVFTSSLGNEAVDKTYRGLMALKGLSMSMIMISPMTHNAVIWGKAMPSLISSMGWKNNLKNIGTLGGYTYVLGHQLRKDHALVNDLIGGGLVPIGGRGMNPDVPAISEGLKPGRSLAAKALGAVLDPISKKAGDGARKGVDALGHFWHETLLWDRIGDMQVGMAVQMRNHFMDAGLDQYSATRIATHFANRYGGAIPQEALSQGAHALLNVMLFSKSFTGTNLGAMKDPIAGLPSDAKAQILEHYAALNRALGKTDIEAQDAAGKVLKQAQSVTRKKAALILAADFGAMAVITTLMQAWIKGDDGDKFLKDLQERAHALGVKLDKENPLAFLGPTWGKAGLPLAALRHPFDNLEMLSQTHDNPHGKQDRIRLGEDEHGNSYYMRLPVGKVVEEMKSYTNMSTASGMLDNKLSPLVKGLVEAKANRQFDGRTVYDADSNLVMQMGQVVGHVMKMQVPFDDFTALKNLMTDNQHKGGKVKLGGAEFDMDEAKLLGTATGLSVSKLTGGDAVAEMRYQAREQQAKLNDVMPDVKDAIMRDDMDKAIDLLQKAGQTDHEIRNTIRRIENPDFISKSKMRRFNQHATEEQQERVEKMMR